MASNSRSGLTKEERARFLQDHGFSPLRSGKGSHELWENPELKLLAHSHHIMPPANLMSNSSQKPWEITLCDNPGGGTWHSIEKYAQWCQGTIEKIKTSSDHERRRCEIARQFRKAVHDMRQWRKDVKHHFSAELDIARVPPAPIKYEDLLVLKSRKNELSKPST
ncbi:MAG: hypothetical protein HY052_05760 [Proteobacteria bacterium]|nr:hypothetical protein [Pseudomonadota bacterium]